MPPRAAPRRTPADPVVDEVDTRFLETLLGYNARRAALAVIGVFLERMQPFQLKPVDFSVLSVVAHNPGLRCRQGCSAVGILARRLKNSRNQWSRHYQNAKSITTP